MTFIVPDVTDGGEVVPPMPIVQCGQFVIPIPMPPIFIPAWASWLSEAEVVDGSALFGFNAIRHTGHAPGNVA